MNTFGKRLKTVTFLLGNLLFDKAQFSEAMKTIRRFVRFCGDLIEYAGSRNAEQIKLLHIRPHLFDNTKSTQFHKHYFYQHNWAFRRILESKVQYHVDVGSRIYLANSLSVIMRVAFIDIRPLVLDFVNLDSIKGSILSMPYRTNSVSSLSCLHVAEHIGLGRYGDLIDPLGTKKAASELSRVLAFGGNLFFSIPIGKPRLIFNARRIHSTQQILDYFFELQLVELSGVDDKGNFIKNIDKATLDSCSFGCGFFWFSKKDNKL